MRPSIYYGGHHRQIATSIRDYINSIPDFLTPQTANSPRAVGGKREGVLGSKTGRMGMTMKPTADSITRDQCVRDRGVRAAA